jgi:hypothetical protein
VPLHLFEGLISITFMLGLRPTTPDLLILPNHLLRFSGQVCALRPLALRTFPCPRFHFASLSIYLPVSAHNQLRADNSDYLIRACRV